ncbi:hypothetical protein [Haloterrigena salifodinae]|nr:hypothetical protein [Haloterrigena salifodinae]
MASDPRTEVTATDFHEYTRCDDSSEVLEDVVPLGDVQEFSAVDARVRGLELRVMKRIAAGLLVPLVGLTDLHLCAVSLGIESEQVPAIALDECLELSLFLPLLVGFDLRLAAPIDQLFRLLEGLDGRILLVDVEPDMSLRFRNSAGIVDVYRTGAVDRAERIVHSALDLERVFRPRRPGE